MSNCIYIYLGISRPISNKYNLLGLQDIAAKQKHTQQNVAVTTSHQEAKSYWLHSAQLLPVFPVVVVYAAFRDPAKELI